MAHFRTILPLPDYTFEVHHRHRILSLGSCFAEHIGQRMEEYKFQNLLNPYGILYNPASVGQGLQRLLQDAPFRPDELFRHQGLWHSFWHHGAFSKPELDDTLEGINQAYHQAQAFLMTANRLILTLGTAFVFVHRHSGNIVANCHKLPGSDFERRRLRPQEIRAALEPILYELKAREPELQVILTVSPVRHIRDGLVENQRSKALLILAADELSREMPFVHYFPSYEIIMDELRDYRFYADDMIHPSPLAIQYVWEKFGQAFFPEPTRQLLKKVYKIVQASQHRPFHPESEEHQAFLQRQLEQIRQLEKEHPYLSFGKERRQFEGQMR